MYLPITGDDLFYKHHDNCGKIENHIQILDVVVNRPLVFYFEDDPDQELFFWEGEDEGEIVVTLWVCDVEMTWLHWGQGDHVYTYPDIELEDPDDWDAAVSAIAAQVK